MVVTIGVLAIAYGITQAAIELPEANPPTDNIIQVELSEFKIHIPDRLPVGAVTFHVVNTGDLDHNIRFKGPGADAQFKQDLQPGDEGDLQINLQQGRYHVWCPVGSHAIRGMDLMLTAGPALGSAASSPGHQADPDDSWQTSDEPTGAPLPTITTTTSAQIPPEGHSHRNKLIVWLGAFHPPMVNFPVALLAVGAFAEVLTMMTGKTEFSIAARFCVRLGAAGALAAGILGWFFAGFHVADKGWIMTTHRWLGTSTVLVAMLAWGLGELSWRQSQSAGARRRYRFAIFLSSALVLATGFLGGALVFGLDHYAWPE